MLAASCGVPHGQMVASGAAPNGNPPMTQIGADLRRDTGSVRGQFTAHGHRRGRDSLVMAYLFICAHLRNLRTNLLSMPAMRWILAALAMTAVLGGAAADAAGPAPMEEIALWDNAGGPHLRGAVITQRRSYAAID